MSNVTPFRLPLDREQFRVALQKGLGRAPMHVAQFGQHGMVDLIVEACTKDAAYDAQCEDSRVPWLMGMIDAAGIESFVVPTILDAFRDNFATKTYWDKNQLCRLALVFAQRGYAEARDALYSALSKNESSADIISAEEIIQLDGSDGLHFVADRVGEWIRNDPSMSAEYYILGFYDQTHGDGSALRILESAARQNPRIAAFLKVAKDDLGAEADERKQQGTIRSDILTRFDTNRPSRFEFIRNWTAEELIRDIQNTIPSENSYRLLYRRWGSKADDDELRTVFEALCIESESALQRFFLHVFLERGFPELSSRAMSFAEHDDPEIRWIAYQVLAQHRHPKIRSLALHRIKDGKIRERELELFIKNYEAGDWQMISGALQLSGDPDQTHACLQDLLDVYEENMGSEAIEPMMLVYEHTPCSNCRYRAVKVLDSMKLLPEWIRDECRDDADESTREFAATQ